MTTPPNPSNYPGGTSDPHFKMDEDQYWQEQQIPYDPLPLSTPTVDSGSDSNNYSNNYSDNDSDDYSPTIGVIILVLPVVLGLLFFLL
ncbi:MAG: hypothetical protein F6K14_27725 [Symploca sp. SIO2C1]|nr:hypothetical protein [Symploca sp. SIO2C1]